MLTRELQNEEAIARMEYLGLAPILIARLKDENTVWQSENPAPGYTIMSMVSAETQKQINEFEEKFNAVVYHAIAGEYDICGEPMEMVTLLYVSDSPEEWEMDREILQNGETVAYVINKTYPEFSEIGMVAVNPNFTGGLVRTDRQFDFRGFGKEMPEINPEVFADNDLQLS